MLMAGLSIKNMERSKMYLWKNFDFLGKTKKWESYKWPVEAPTLQGTKEPPVELLNDPPGMVTFWESQCVVRVFWFSYLLPSQNLEEPRNQRACLALHLGVQLSLVLCQLLLSQSHLQHLVVICRELHDDVVVHSLAPSNGRFQRQNKRNVGVSLCMRKVVPAENEQPHTKTTTKKRTFWKRSRRKFCTDWHQQAWHGEDTAPNQICRAAMIAAENKQRIKTTTQKKPWASGLRSSSSLPHRRLLFLATQPPGRGRLDFQDLCSKDCRPWISMPGGRLPVGWILFPFFDFFISRVESQFLKWWFFLEARDKDDK